MSTIQIIIIALVVANIAVNGFILYKRKYSESYAACPANSAWEDGFGGCGPNEFKTYSGCNCIGAGLKSNQNMTNDSQLYANSQYQGY
jgi:hypothetical protein